jgi:biuret amidohydrolase
VRAELASSSSIPRQEATMPYRFDRRGEAAVQQAYRMAPTLASTLRFCREQGIRVIYTAHVHRQDGCDMGLYDDLYPPIADRSVVVDGSPGAEIYRDLAPASGEHVVKKHRYSGFFATDMD